MRLLLIFSIVAFFASCSDSENDCLHPIDSVCFSFDIRQCQTDGFADSVSENGTVEERENGLKDWMESQNIFLEDVKLVTNFHEAVCEACHVCPQGDRYYIQLIAQTGLEDLDLLNLEEVECCDHFGG